MSQPLLKPLEIEDLLNQYRSDLRKLEYQIHKTQTVIQELEKQAAEAQEALSLEEAKVLPEAEETKTPAPAKRKAKTSGGRRGRPRKAKPADSDKVETAEATEAAPEKTPAKRGRKPGSGKKKRGPGRPPKKKSAKKGTAGKKGRQPSLSDWDEFVINSLKTKQQALITKDFVEIAKENPDIKSGEAQIKVKLNRSLHKLANRQNVLEKVEYSGRGFAYALKEWVNNKGLLPKKYAR